MKRKPPKYRSPRWNRQEITPAQIKEFLVGKRIRLDCGHHYCVHPLSNTLVMTGEGKAWCAECYD